MKEVDKLVVTIKPELDMSKVISQLIDLREAINGCINSLTKDYVENPSFESGLNE